MVGTPADLERAPERKMAGRATAEVESSCSIHTARPSVYLDQWVWVRLAKARAGRPDERSDLHVLAALREAADAGVAFPLSATHYFETLAVTDPRQRRDLAAVMGPISRFLNLRPTEPLVRHQLLTAFHELYGRPTFRPADPTVLDLGVGWAMAGAVVPLKIMMGDREATDAEIPNRRQMLRALGQLGETRLIAGPADEEIDRLRELGFRPETTAAATASRLQRERNLADYLQGVKVSRQELRVWLVARELTHEYLDTLNAILNEYRLDPLRLFSEDPIVPGSMRADMMRLSDMIPTMRVAADMKLEVFRNAQRPWTVNMMHDIDALSLAVPYCHVVVPDKDAADLLRRSQAHDRHGTQVVTRLEDLLPVVAQLAAQVNEKNLSGWDHVGPEAAFCASEEDLPPSLARPVGA